MRSQRARDDVPPHARHSAHVVLLPACSEAGQRISRFSFVQPVAGVTRKVRKPSMFACTRSATLSQLAIRMSANRGWAGVMTVPDLPGVAQVGDWTGGEGAGAGVSYLARTSSMPRDSFRHPPYRVALLRTSFCRSDPRSDRRARLPTPTTEVARTYAVILHRMQGDCRVFRSR
jgi:hypothetical protein